MSNGDTSSDKRHEDIINRIEKGHEIEISRIEKYSNKLNNLSEKLGTETWKLEAFQIFSSGMLDLIKVESSLLEKKVKLETEVKVLKSKVHPHLDKKSY